MKKYLILLCLFICYSCTYDYDNGYDIENFEPQVIVNSIISPQSPIRAHLLWSKFYNDETELKKVSKFDTELYEDDILVAKINDSDSLVVTSIYPKIGKKYRLKITVPDYGEVSAQTYIPIPATAIGEFVGNKGDGNFRTYQHAKVTEINPVEKFRASWVRCYGHYENGDMKKPSDLYSINHFTDQINAVMDSYDAQYRGSNIGYEDFIRVPYKNLSLVTPIEFSVWLENEKSIEIDYGIIRDEWGVPIPYYLRDDIPLDEWGIQILYEIIKMDYLLVAVITPSDDYDKYFKTWYRHSLSSFEPDMPFMGGDIVPVYCNIENGLGIFAGYSETSLKLTTNY